MVTANQAETLLMPLLVRAHAVRAWPQVGFVDQAAEYLVHKLDLDRRDWGVSDHLSAQHQLELTRCKWIDEQVGRFLTAYPDALGIELGAGLSTRFQRLSAASDWPRFSWADVDAADVIDCADLLFPRTDNYRLVACDIVRDDWLGKAGWQPQQPLLVIIQSLPAGAGVRELQAILSPLLNALGGTPVPVHLVLDYASPALRALGTKLGFVRYGSTSCAFTDAQDLLWQLELKGCVLREQDLAVDDQAPFMHRLLAKLYRRWTGKHFHGVVHLRLDTNKPGQRPENKPRQLPETG